MFQTYPRRCRKCDAREPRTGLMSDQHKKLSAAGYGLPVKGYSEQPTAAVELVNENKLLEERCLRVLDDLRLDHTVDQRWLQIGRTHLEQAWMCVNRAIFKPVRIEVGDDA
jgi:hypothetical protein